MADDLADGNKGEVEGTAVAGGMVEVEGGRARPSLRVRKGDVVRVRVPQPAEPVQLVPHQADASSPW